MVRDVDGMYIATFLMSLGTWFCAKRRRQNVTLRGESIQVWCSRKDLSLDI